MPWTEPLAEPAAGDGPDAPEPLVRLEAVTLRLRERWILAGTSWTIRPGERWAVLGPNGAGKTTLVRALTGEVPVVRGRLRPAEPLRLRSQAALVSFERGRGLLLRAEAHARARAFAGDPDPGLRVDDVLPPAGGGAGEAAWGSFPGIDRLRGRRLAELSTGELRRLQIARALAAAPRLLILDEPCEGLDAEARAALAAYLDERLPRRCALVWVTHRPEELPAGITHLLAVREGRVVFQGRADREAWARIEEMLLPPSVRPARALPAASGGRRPGEVQIALRGVRVVHRGATVFGDLSWTVRAGEHWAVVGPNGSGKSTLLRLLTGEHPQAHANRIEVLGARFGGRRTLREHRRDIGWVSAELHLAYGAATTAREVVLSGYFDAIGLYRRVPEEACAAAWRLLADLDALELAERPFLQLSAGEQRRVLLARALVKPPRILILDEPCQGLDPFHRRRFLEAVDRFAAGRTTVIYVSHRESELPRCITHRLRLVRPAHGPTRTEVELDPRAAIPE